jgi:hypothetical protein
MVDFDFFGVLTPHSAIFQLYHGEAYHQYDVGSRLAL